MEMHITACRQVKQALALHAALATQLDARLRACHEHPFCVSSASRPNSEDSLCDIFTSALQAIHSLSTWFDFIGKIQWALS